MSSLAVGTPDHTFGVGAQFLTLVDLLEWRAHSQPERRVYRSLDATRRRELRRLGLGAMALPLSRCVARHTTRRTRFSPEAVRDWLTRWEINVSFVPTPVAEPMIGLEWSKQTKLKTLLTGGDRLHACRRHHYRSRWSIIMDQPRMWS